VNLWAQDYTNKTAQYLEVMDIIEGLYIQIPEVAKLLEIKA